MDVFGALDELGEAGQLAPGGLVEGIVHLEQERLIRLNDEGFQRYPLSSHLRFLILSRLGSSIPELQEPHFEKGRP
jgi:hypothetical protein